jgi:septum formation protein
VISADRPLVLGSGSPRRRAILADLAIPIRVVPADADERVRVGEAPSDYLERVVRMKLASVAAKPAGRDGAGLIVADTIVVVDGEILGKPADVADARLLLARIVGRAHVVYTRYALALPADLAAPVRERSVETRVWMRAAGEREIAGYAATGEGLDKAGAYAAQGVGQFLIERIEGSYTNVVGLPACEVVMDLVETGLIASYP